jgi:hypothetical protein
LPDSSSRLLTEADLEGLTKDELALARNEIYARHGRKFQNRQMREYFESKSWYEPIYEPSEFPVKLLSDVEQRNITFITEHE